MSDDFKCPVMSRKKHNKMCSPKKGKRSPKEAGNIGAPATEEPKKKDEGGFSTGMSIGRALIGGPQKHWS